MTLSIIIIISITLLYILMTYNKLIAEIENVKNTEKQIDVQLDRRAKVFESLVNIVKKYMDYEQTTLKQITSLRSTANIAKEKGETKTRIIAENKISDLARNINIQFENYPKMKANQNIIQLQEEITSTENKLAFAKQAFNDSIERYNTHKKSLFTSIVVNLFKKLDVEFFYWNINEDKRKQLEDSRVEL